MEKSLWLQRPRSDCWPMSLILLLCLLICAPLCTRLLFHKLMKRHMSKCLSCTVRLTFMRKRTASLVHWEPLETPTSFSVSCSLPCL
ncbi:hypothetical protein E2C01_095116 [Portunus trituberculatus]|uniref:Uncharacterized protein n=1 Tax=Portunus trituberculatus TaxID=210409 RepID=A0A5B7K3E7_PORTR|nr:hypothetical protein [Portunus trituberculatus]